MFVKNNIIMVNKKHRNSFIHKKNTFFLKKKNESHFKKKGCVRHHTHQLAQENKKTHLKYIKNHILNNKK